MEKEYIHFNKSGLPITIHNIDMQKHDTYRGLHSHTAVEIIMVNRGLLNCYINGNTISVHANQIVMINRNIVHKLSSDHAHITYIQIDISSYTDDHYLQEYTSLYQFISISNSIPYLIYPDTGNTTDLDTSNREDNAQILGLDTGSQDDNTKPLSLGTDSRKDNADQIGLDTNTQEIRNILHKINTRYHDTRECSKWYLKAYIYELTAFMHSHSFLYPPMSFMIQPKKIEGIVRYIDTHFKSSVKLEDICEATGYTKSAICHIFKAATGKTVFDYINYLRIHYAVERLRESDDTILEIATESGFSSASYFNRVFKNIMGGAPTEYRKLLKIKHFHYK